MSKHENQYLLRILDEVSRDGDLTQRSLSRRLGVALGLTNLYVKRLARNGYIKVVNIKPNRLRYELTPSGIAKKTTLTFQYLKESYVFFREARRNLTTTFEAIKGAGVDSVLLYGTGELAEIALLSLQEAKLVVAGVVSAQQAGASLCGHSVLPVASIGSIAFDRIVVIEDERSEAEKELKKFKIDAQKIIWVGAR